MTMNKNKKPDILAIEDPEERKKAIEQVLKDMDEKAIAWGEPAAPISDVQDRYDFSCTIIMICSIVATLVLAVCAAYYTTLPRPHSYVSTQDGKLYSLEPARIEK